MNKLAALWATATSPEGGYLTNRAIRFLGHIVLMFVIMRLTWTGTILYITANWQEWHNNGSTLYLVNKSGQLQGVSRIEVPVMFSTEQRITVPVVMAQSISVTVEEEADVTLVVPV